MNNEWNDEVVVDVSESDITVDQAYDATSSNPQSGTAVAQAVAQVQPGATYSAGDAIAISGDNKISVKVDGTTIGIDSTTKELKSLQSIPTVDQTYNASSANAQSGTAVAGAIAGVKQVPAYSAADSGKVLQVQADGSLAWVTLS